MQPIGPLSEQVWYRPNWRELQARDYTLRASDEYVERYRTVLRKREASGDDAMVAVHLLSNDVWLRGQIESYTMAGLTPREICTRFYIQPVTVETYCKVFCDVEPLKDFTGSLLRSCFDTTAGKELCRMRLFGLRYGAIFLDWILSKITILTEEQFSVIESRLRSALLMKSMEIEVASISDSERYDMMLKVINTLTKYKSQLVPVTSTTDIEAALSQLKALVKSAPAPKGLSAEVLKTELALPQGGSSNRPTLRSGMN